MLLVSIVFFGTLLPSPAGAQTVRGRSGNDASRSVPLAQGLAVFDVQHRGPGAFVVHLVDSEGTIIGTLALTEGPFGGTKSVKVPSSGHYLLDVTATGDWTVSLRTNGPDLSGLTGEDPEYVEGIADGTGAGGSSPSTLGWGVRGFVGGLLGGPFGGALAAKMATSRSMSDADRVIGTLGVDRSAGYVSGYREGYATGLSSRRRKASVIGSALGSAVLGFVIIRAVTLGESRSFADPPIDNPPATVIPISIPIGR